MSHFFKIITLLAAVALLLPSVASAQVVINEIMYHPLSDQNGDDFLELYNTGGAPVDLSDWRFDGITLQFTPGTSIAAGQYLVLSPDAASFLTTYGSSPDHVYTLELNDNGERVALLNAGLVVQDEVIFDDAGPWPVTPDGLGPSLELIDPDQDNATPRNWHASVADGGTPGALNSVDAAGLPPWIEGVQHTVDVQPGNPLIVTATVLDATSVQLNYVIDFGTENSATMLDDGGSNDGAPGDLVYGVSIPAQPAGKLIRYRITATGSTGTMDYPRDDDSVPYDGTAVIDPALSSSLPILQWFMDPAVYDLAIAHKNTDETEPCVLFYDGQLYDGVLARVRGQSARLWPKPPWKFFMPQGHNLEAPQLFDRPVDTFAMQSNYSDKSFMRELLGWDTFREAGCAYNQVHPIHVEQNGAFFGLYNFLEANDRDWMVRNRLDPEGAFYKAFDDLRSFQDIADLEEEYEKETRLYEDYSDLHSFTTDLNALTGQALTDFIYDNVDIPAVLNYMAVQTVLHNNDHLKKNYYIYRDSLGTGRWAFYAWDLDLTFGRNWVYGSLNDEIWADVDYVAGEPNVSPSHPLFGDSEHQKLSGVWNRLVDRVLAVPEIQTMYYRRLRTLMDKVLITGRFEARIADLSALFATEAEADRQKWGWFGADQDLATATGILEQEYLNPRRVHLYTTHTVCGIPGAQPLLPPIVISEIMYAPLGGQDHEFVEFYNPSPIDAVDISGWRLDGVALTLPCGTVIPPLGYALLVKNDPLFRAEYGGGKFVAAQYDGSLDDLGETLVLRNQNGGQVSAVTYEAALPWPAAAAGAGSSLELIDSSRDTDKVVNWAASSGAGGTPGAANSSQGSIADVPPLYVNEVLPVNANVNQDGAGDYDPWVEIYNASTDTIALDGMYLSTDFGTPDMWPIPAGTDLCGGCWVLFWADGETGEGTDHTNFTLSPTGGTVALFAAGGSLIDYLNYGTLAADSSLGRFPDGQSDLRVFSIVTPEAANDVPPVEMILNEYNAVDDLNFLDNLKSDTYWGRVEGNGGDWFELVVTQDHLDARDWELHVTNDTGGAGETTYVLTLTNDTLWSDLRAGTIITVSELLADDIGFDPETGDWWINVQASSTASGLYISAQDFEVTNTNWQLTIKDDLSQTVFGPAGEGIWPVSGVGSSDIFKLEQDPGPFVTPVSDYNDGTSSTFGAPNVWASGTRVQDFTALWEQGIVGECSGADTDSDGYCDSQDNCPTVANPDQADADGDGDGDLCDTCPSDPYNDAEGDGHCADVDNCPSLVNAGQADADSDTVGDVCDNCASAPNTDQADEDSDTIGDVCDACLGDPVNDPDTDGVCDSVDNCPAVDNPLQEDGDSDGTGDACDSCPADPFDDIDLDGLCADADNCPTASNAGQGDVDSDTVGDACDNCVSTANASQTDTDSDLQGDACDDDDDGDTVLDGPDNCDLVFNLAQTDTDSNGVGDLCDDDDDGDGVNDLVDNCPMVPNAGQADADSDGAGDDCDCAPALKGVSTLPGHLATTLRIDKTSGGTLTWKRGPQGHVSNVYRGTFTAGQAWSYDESCFDEGNADTEALDPADPANPGEGFYYLVAGSNTCGDGPAGVDSLGGDIVPAVACTGGSADSDSDGVDDYADNCANDSNAGQDDADLDFVGTACDNCPGDTNQDQADLNLDGEGDICDDDDDGDGVIDTSDNCPVKSNANQSDQDSDGEGDICDSCTDADSDGLGTGGSGENFCAPDPFPDDPENDADGDGIAGPADNCPELSNPDQADCDLDGLGDVCDNCTDDPGNDIDGDGLCAGTCNVVDVTVIEFSSPDETVLVEAGSAMQYLANTEDPGLALTWTEELFDDSGWTAGTYGVGYEADTGAEALLQTTVAVGTQSVYSRTTFNITNPAEVDDLWIGADYDDGFVAWINGVEVYRSPEIPAGTLEWNTSSFSNESSNGSVPEFGQLTDISGPGISALKTGTNVLAVGIWNHIPATPPSTDLVLVPKLTMNRQTSMTYLDNQADPLIGMTWTAEAFDDSPWEAGNYGVGFDTFTPGGAENLIATQVPVGTSTVYSRARFIIPDVSLLDEVLLGADYDDGYVAWINGVEVYRSPEMPVGSLTWDSSPSLHESSNAAEPQYGVLEDIASIAVPQLHNGVNVLAVGVWNNRPDSTDLVVVPILATNGLGVDNCVEDYNPGQEDQDHDGIGDVCDNCPAVFNPVQFDADLDGLGDACDP